MKTFKFGKLNVVTSNETIESYGVPAGLPCAMLYDNETVYVPSSFHDLSESIKHAFLTHETGHAHLNHLALFEDNKDELILNAQIEAEADAYAANVLGREVYVKALNDFTDHLLKMYNVEPGTMHHAMIVGETDARIFEMDNVLAICNTPLTVIG